MLKHYFPDRLFDPELMTLETFNAPAIATSLSRINRWQGNGLFPLSVAQHSTLLSLIVPQHLRLPALLHDVPEVFCGDTNGVLLREMGHEIEAYQQRILQRIALIFNFPYALFQEHHPYDKKIANDERKALFGHELDPSQLLGVPVEPTSVDDARRHWLIRLAQLTDDAGASIQYWQAAA